MLFHKVLVAAVASYLTVLTAGASETPEYETADYITNWADVDGDCLDSRDEVLLRDAIVSDAYSGRGCSVETGIWLDLYTGIILANAADIEIDHIIPLAWAHRHGAAA